MELNNIIKVYIKADTAGNIIDVNSSVFLHDITNWIEIDEGTGDKYAHAQGNYFKKSIIAEGGIYQYKLVDGTVVEKTAEEIEAEIEKLPPPGPTPMEELQKENQLLNAKITAVTERNDFIEDCMAEMAMKVY